MEAWAAKGNSRGKKNNVDEISGLEKIVTNIFFSSISSLFYVLLFWTTSAAGAGAGSVAAKGNSRVDKTT